MRDNLLKLLKGGQAHLTVKKALEGLGFKTRVIRFPASGHSIYEELEHMRLAQEDILRYTLDPAWESPQWPEGYWPLDNDDLTEKKWSNTITRFFNDLEEVIQLTRNPDIDLNDPIPHGEMRTYLRQILLVADHNAYHLGKIMLIRRALEK